MKNSPAVPIDMEVIDLPESFFFDIGVDSRAVYFHFDTQKNTISGHADIRYWWVGIQDFLDTCVNEKIIVDYDLRRGLVWTWDGLDNNKEHAAGPWLDWFVKEGDTEAVQTVCRKTTRDNYKSRLEMLNSIEA